MNLRIALCQTGAVWRSVSENLRRIEPLVAAADADVVVLPELFATGFDPEAAAIAEPSHRPIHTPMSPWAARYRRAVAGSVAVAEDGAFRNRMYFVAPSGEVARYDKRHLFRPGGEAAAYAPGDRRVVVEYRGWRLLLAVCYDLRFPVWSRCRGDYDAIVCCAAWPAVRRDAWRTLVRARAIENQCYVVAVNRAGEDPGIGYAGDSAAVDFRGATLAKAGRGERTLVAGLDRAALDAFRERFPAWMDADDFELR